MFKNDTVFILGAGASWHYGYPTGEGMVDQLLDMARRLREHSSHRISTGIVTQEMPQYLENKYNRSLGNFGGKQAWEAMHAECEAFINRLATTTWS